MVKKGTRRLRISAHKTRVEYYVMLCMMDKMEKNHPTQFFFLRYANVSCTKIYWLWYALGLVEYVMHQA